MTHDLQTVEILHSLAGLGLNRLPIIKVQNSTSTQYYRERPASWEIFARCVLNKTASEGLLSSSPRAFECIFAEPKTGDAACYWGFPVNLRKFTLIGPQQLSVIAK